MTDEHRPNMAIEKVSKLPDEITQDEDPILYIRASEFHAFAEHNRNIGFELGRAEAIRETSDLLIARIDEKEKVA